MSDLPWSMTERETRVRPDGGDGDGADSGDQGVDDAALIRQSISEPDCFARLFDRHALAIYRYIARRLGPDVADDLASEVFLVAFQRRGRYDPAQLDARPWLYGIATNLISRRRRDEVRFFRALARITESPDAEPLADQVTRRVDAQAVSGRLAGALASLPGQHRDTLLLIASGLSQEEAARALAVPVGTVASRLARARRKLRAALGADHLALMRGE
jgi:RNA polymerase sigma-70 factor (ECF subfamily)